MTPGFDLSGKSILVTGANRGIGKSIALMLGAAGAEVGVCHSGRSSAGSDQAADVANQIAKLGGKAHILALDLSGSDTDLASAMTTFLEKTGGKIDALVNNAGVNVDQLVLRFKFEDWSKVMDTNLRGAFFLSKAALRPMVKAGGGSIVNMSSVIGLSGNAGQSVYSASKAGLIGLTKSMAQEYGGKKIRVNAVAPGFIETEMTDKLPEAAKLQILQKIALGELGTGDDVAYGVLYLVSPASRYVTGTVLNINGGLYM